MCSFLPTFICCLIYTCAQPQLGGIMVIGEEHTQSAHASAMAVKAFEPDILLLEAIGTENGGQQYIDKTRKTLMGYSYPQLMASNPLNTDIMLWMANQVNSTMEIRAFGRSDTIAISNSGSTEIQITHQNTLKAMQYVTQTLQEDPYKRILIAVGASHLFPISVSPERVVPLNSLVTELDLKLRSPYKNILNSNLHNSTHAAFVNVDGNQYSGEKFIVSNLTSFDLLSLFPPENTSSLVFLPDYFWQKPKAFPSGMHVVYEHLSNNPQDNVDRVKDFFNKLPTKPSFTHKNEL